MKTEQPFISIVLGSYNRRAFLKATIKNIREHTIEFPYEIIVVDGGSTDGALEWLAKQKDILTIVQHNRGKRLDGSAVLRRSWGYFMNLAFKAAQGKYILMISDDCLLVPGAIKNGAALFEELLGKGEKVGAVAFYWRNWPKHKDYYVGRTLGKKLFVNHGLYLRDAIEKVGWIDEQSYKFYYADSDLCLRLWNAGYCVVDCKTAFVEHYNHLKAERISYSDDLDVYLKKWAGIFYDPEKDDFGGKAYLSFIDKTKTYKKFPVGRIPFLENFLNLQKKSRRLFKRIKKMFVR